MIWDRFREWRDRRSALKELGDLARDEEARLLDRDDNPLHRALALITLGQHEAAAEQWTLARSLLPNAILRRAEPLEILCDLRRFDEAEALMRERMRCSPRDRFPMEGLARIAEARGDLAVAVERWAAVRDFFPDRAHGYYGMARCLLALDRLDEAARQADLAIERGPDQLDGWVIRAIVSDRKKTWEESIERWSQLTVTHRHRAGYAHAAKAMAELGRIAEAEDYLRDPAERYKNDLEIGITRAHLAERRGDLPEACDRWALVRRGNPGFWGGYADAMRCLCALGRFDEAEAVSEEALNEFPGQAWPFVEHAALAEKRGDWNEAAARWAVLRERFPDQEAGYRRGAEALRVLGRVEEAEALSRGGGA